MSCDKMRDELRCDNILQGSEAGRRSNLRGRTVRVQLQVAERILFTDVQMQNPDVSLVMLNKDRIPPSERTGVTQTYSVTEQCNINLICSEMDFCLQRDHEVKEISPPTCVPSETKCPFLTFNRFSRDEVISAGVLTVGGFRVWSTRPVSHVVTCPGVRWRR